MPPLARAVEYDRRPFRAVEYDRLKPETAVDEVTFKLDSFVQVWAYIDI